MFFATILRFYNLRFLAVYALYDRAVLIKRIFIGTFVARYCMVAQFWATHSPQLQFRPICLLTGKPPPELISIKCVVNNVMVFR